eukprot:5705025-Amphidinium_carterae.1
MSVTCSARTTTSIASVAYFAALGVAIPRFCRVLLCWNASWENHSENEFSSEKSEFNLRRLYNNVLFGV